MRDHTDSQDAGGVTVSFYLNGCLVATGVTKQDGDLRNQFQAFLPKTTYTFVATGGGYSRTTGSLTSEDDGDIKTSILMNL